RRLQRGSAGLSGGGRPRGTVDAARARFRRAGAAAAGRAVGGPGGGRQRRAREPGLAGASRDRGACRPFRRARERGLSGGDGVGGSVMAERAAAAADASGVLSGLSAASPATGARQTIACAAPYGEGGLGQHLAQLVEDARAEETLERYYAAAVRPGETA